MSIDAMKQALEALELLARYENPATKIQVRKPRDGGSIVTMYPHKVASEAATALRAAIDQAQQELVCVCGAIWEGQELVSSPPQRKPLTEKRIEELYSFWVVDCQDIVGFARAIERTVKGEV